MYLLYRGNDGGYDECDRQADHDPVGEVVDAEVECDIASEDKDARLEDGAEHVVLHATTEGKLKHGAARVLQGGRREGRTLDLVLDQVRFASSPVGWRRCWPSI